MDTLYKVLIVVCLLFVAAGIVYVMVYLPQIPHTPATPPPTGYLPVSNKI
ncbi:hypothetical protein [Brevibacillus sp. SYSU BS000544]